MFGLLNYDIANYSECQMINKNWMENLSFLTHFLKNQDAISFAKHFSIS